MKENAFIWYYECDNNMSNMDWTRFMLIINYRYIIESSKRTQARIKSIFRYCGLV